MIPLESATQPCTLESVRAMERRIALAFPLDYVEFLLVNDGGRPANNRIFVGRGSSGVESFLSLEMGAEIFPVVSSRRSKRWPFAADWSGNYFVFARRRDSWRVAFWDHETGRLATIAESFADFRQKLQPPPPPPVLAPGQADGPGWIRPDVLEFLRREGLIDETVGKGSLVPRK